MIDREALAKEWEELLKESSKIQSRVKALDLAFRSTTDELAELYLREDITGPVKTCIEGIDHVLFDLNQKVYWSRKIKAYYVYILLLVIVNILTWKRKQNVIANVIVINQV